jgi:hypothetical protein
MLFGRLLLVTSVRGVVGVVVFVGGVSAECESKLIVGVFLFLLRFGVAFGNGGVEMVWDEEGWV